MFVSSLSCLIGSWVSHAMLIVRKLDLVIDVFFLYNKKWWSAQLAVFFLSFYNFSACLLPLGSMTKSLENDKKTKPNHNIFFIVNIIHSHLSITPLFS